MPIGTEPLSGIGPPTPCARSRPVGSASGMRLQVVEQRLRDAGDDGKTAERQRLAGRIHRPREHLVQRLVVRVQHAGDRRCVGHLEITDATVAVGVEIHQRRAAEIRAVVDERLRQPTDQGARGHGLLHVHAGLESERSDEIVDAGRGLQQALLHRHAVGERIGILDETVDVVAPVAATAQRVRHRPAETERQLAPVVAAEDQLRETLVLLQVVGRCARDPTSARRSCNHRSSRVRRSAAVARRRPRSNPSRPARCVRAPAASGASCRGSSCPPAPHGCRRSPARRTAWW